MKKYILVIDPSAAVDTHLYVYESKTVKEAKVKLESLNLSFEPNKVYCAVIGKKLPGPGYRYVDILRTDNGKTWHRSSDTYVYDPSGWRTIDDQWETMGLCKRESEEA